MVIKEQERQEAVKLQEQYAAQLDLQEKKRAEEWAAREKRVQDSMNRMGEVIKKSDEAEKR